MPIIQDVLKDKSLAQRSFARQNIDIRALIISPTRELAEQIATEAKKVVSATNVRVQVAVGGTGKAYALQRMKREGCHILVGTPGRVKDLLSDQYSGVDVSNVQTFVLDEADRLLDIGFAPEIEQIQSYMPNRDQHPRQTLMFSATVPREVVGLVRRLLRPNFKFIRTTDPNEQPTHERVPQKVAFLKGLENRLPALLELAHRKIEEHRQDPKNVPPFKAIVYFPSTADVTVSAEIFKNMRGSLDGSSFSNFKHPLEPTEIIQISSRLSQSERTQAAARFKSATSAILFSSDVTARGMDFPNVSHVIQVGLPRNDDDYIHRLGRTGRAGKSGEGWLLVQERQMREFRRGLGADLPIHPDNTIETATLDMTQAANVSENASNVLKQVHQAVKNTPFMQKAQAYVSMFGVLRSEKYKDMQEMVDDLNDLARYGWGLEELPTVGSDFVNKMGLRNVEGLNIKDGRGSSGRDDSRGGFRGRGSDRGSDPFASDDPFAEPPSRGRGSGGRDSFQRDPFQQRQGGFQRREGGSRGNDSFRRRY